MSIVRVLIALMIVCCSVSPAPLVAQAVGNEANAAANAAGAAEDTTTTTNTTTTNTTTKAAEGDDSRINPPGREIDDRILEQSGTALLKLFVLAVILESALALLFNWRPFVARYDGRGVKAPISFGAALALVFIFTPDAIASLMNGYGPDVNSIERFFARVIEAMVIAGGSTGVNRLLVALGFRSVVRAQEVIMRPKPTEAWISVGLDREAAVGPVVVEMEVEDQKPAIGGTISGTRAAKRSFFRRDDGRLPPSGGYSVPPHKQVSVKLRDGSGQESATWGPHRLMPGAIVDIDLKL